MKKLIEEKLYQKDMRLLKKRGNSAAKLIKIIDLLLNDQSLPHNARPHKLKGEYEGFWECHIEGDWLLIYTYDSNNLWLHRTGRHQDLFKKY